VKPSVAVTLSLVVGATLLCTLPGRRAVAEPSFLQRFEPELSGELAALRADMLSCTKTAASVGELMMTSQLCAKAESDAARLREQVIAMRWREDVTSDERRALELVDADALASGLYAAAEHARRAAELPDIPFGQSNFALTMQVFGGLFRLQSHEAGSVFSALTGVGGGLKLRYDYVHANTRREAIGLNLGLFFEKTSSDPDKYAMSTVLLLSTFGYFYAGLGVRLVGTDQIPETVAARLFLVIGVGVDGKSLN
jgi:hypothetical protein